MQTLKKLATAALLLSGCVRAPAPTAPDAGRAVDAGPITPMTLDLVVNVPDGGVERHALLGLETPVVPPARELTVESNRALRNVRIRILDEADRALESDDVPDESGPTFRYHVLLLGPLEAGHRYALLVDAQSGATFQDGAGKEIPEQRLEFRTSGERERPGPAPSRKRKRRH